MADKSGIEYVDATWNITSGCSPVSAGCLHCWARRLAEGRLRGRFGYPKVNPFRVTLHPRRIAEPHGWRKPRRIFVSSMGDLFNGAVPFDYIYRVYSVAQKTPRHTYLVLTKREARRLRFYEWVRKHRTDLALSLPNVWEGVSVEHADNLDRIDRLVATPAAVRFVSCEPLLGPLDLGRYLSKRQGGSWTDSSWHLPALDWVIVGGETGPGARQMEPDWVYSIRDQCQRARVPFFFKGWGSWPMHSGRLLDGREWNEYPTGKENM